MCTRACTIAHPEARIAFVGLSRRVETIRPRDDLCAEPPELSTRAERIWPRRGSPNGALQIVAARGQSVRWMAIIMPAMLAKDWMGVKKFRMPVT